MSKERSSTTFIYALIDPRNGNIRYIGKANNPRTRFNSHVFDLAKTKKTNWIKSLVKIGLKPELLVIDEVLISEWIFWEMHYISLFKFYGFKLTNLTDGGEGGSLIKRIMTQETKEKLSRIHLNRTKEQKKISLLKSAETRKLNEKTRKEKYLLNPRKMSDSTKEKLRQLKLNMSDEYRRKLSIANTGKRPTKDTLIKLKESHANQKNENLRVSIVQLDLNGKFIKNFESISEASRVMQGNAKGSANLTACLKKKRNLYKGYKWEYQHKFSNENLNNTNI